MGLLRDLFVSQSAHYRRHAHRIIKMHGDTVRRMPPPECFVALACLRTAAHLTPHLIGFGATVQPGAGLFFIPDVRRINGAQFQSLATILAVDAAFWISYRRRMPDPLGPMIARALSLDHNVGLDAWNAAADADTEGDPLRPSVTDLNQWEVVQRTLAPHPVRDALASVANFNRMRNDAVERGLASIRSLLAEAEIDDAR